MKQKIIDLINRLLIVEVINNQDKIIMDSLLKQLHTLELSLNDGLEIDKAESIYNSLKLPIKHFLGDC